MSIESALAGSEPHEVPSLRVWRGVHIVASGALSLLAVIHSGLTPVFYSRWSAGALWFLGTGLGLLLLGLLNLVHIGREPCRQPTARFVRLANWAFVLFGVGAVVTLPEPQAFVVTAALIVQAVTSHRTLPGPA